MRTMKVFLMILMYTPIKSLFIPESTQSTFVKSTEKFKLTQADIVGTHMPLDDVIQSREDSAMTGSAYVGNLGWRIKLILTSVTQVLNAMRSNFGDQVRTSSIHSSCIMLNIFTEDLKQLNRSSSDKITEEHMLNSTTYLLKKASDILEQLSHNNQLSDDLKEQVQNLHREFESTYRASWYYLSRNEQLPVVTSPQLRACSSLQFEIVNVYSILNQIRGLLISIQNFLTIDDILG